MGKITDLVSAIDAIVADVEAAVDLPGHATERYTRPPAITSEQCPLLVVSCARVAWDLIATPAVYFVKPEVFVAWFVAAAEQTEDLDGFGALAKSAAEIGDAIGDRIANYATGIPGIDATWARVVETTLERAEGLVFGVVHRMEVER